MTRRQEHSRPRNQPAHRRGRLGSPSPRCLLLSLPEPWLLVLLAAASGPRSVAPSAGPAAITGVVTYEGDVPSPVIVMEGGGRQEVLEVDPRDRGLRFAVVSVDDASPTPAGPPGPAALMDQAGFQFRPPVLAVVRDQEVSFTNSDGANHSVRSRDAEPANRFDAYPTAGRPYTHRFRAKPDGSPVVVTCDVHSWMIGWVYVFAHPFFAVTDGHGRFRIDGLAPGLHRLTVRHPAGLDRRLVARAGDPDAAPIAVVFNARDLPGSGRPAAGRAGPARR